MKKKITYISITILMIISFIIVIGIKNISKGYTATDINGLTWYYEISNGTAVNVYLYSGTPSDTLTIPETLGGYTVTGIRGKGTSTSSSNSNRVNILGTYATNSTIKNIIIPETVTSIGVNTFANFQGLIEINIPTAVTSIGAYAYYNCNNAAGSINVGGNVTSIGTYAFYNCKAINGLIIGSKVNAIGNYAFYNCYNIEGTIALPDSITTVNATYFGTMNKVEKFIIGNGVTNIPTGFFENYSKLGEIIVSEDNANYCAENGILFNKAKTTLMRCPSAKVIENFVVPSTVTAIDSSAFYNCSNVNGKITFSDSLITIGSKAFQGSNISGELIIPDSVTTINSYAFYNCSKLSSLTLGSKVATIASYAFYNCSGLKGDLNIPDSVTSIQATAFANCTGFDGTLTIGNGIKTIQNMTFQYDSGFKKAILSSNVTSINNYAFEGFSDIWINNTQNNVTVATYFGGQSDVPYIHWSDDTHEVIISAVPGVKIVNTDTNEEVISGDYMCETSFNYKVEIEDGYSYPNLKLIEINNDDTENFKTSIVDTAVIYSFDRLVRNRAIYIQNLNSELDLSLRTFITEVNRESIGASRIPNAKLVNGKFEYLHTKYPVTVRNGNLVTYKIRVYNEGLTSGTATKVAAYIPEGLIFDSTNRTNIVNGWTVDGNGKISTTILNDKEIKSYTGNGKLDYKDIELVVKVVHEKTDDEDIRMNLIAEIESESSVDADSTCGSIKNALPADYKKDECYNSTASSYIKGKEDDDDFDNVLIMGKIKVEYGLKINKIDTDTKELLAGAKFNLLNEKEEIIATKTTDETGVLDFGTLTTYGEGEDIYYIDEAVTPEGYVAVQQQKIKVTVIKTIIDEEKGTYSVNVICDLLDYHVDTTRYEYTPIETAEQLQKIGSGEVVTIDGVDYEYNINTNYRLMDDIDLNGSIWTPISNEMKCIIDGNGHKISNLTIASTEESENGEIGLFSVFSGIIENLELENVTVSYPNFVEKPITKSGYTGVGAFAGVMKEGYLINCKVSGNVSIAADNIGGFVGHTAKAGMVKVQNCTNNANVTGKTLTVERAGKNVTILSSNVGGIIGCALGAISITDSTNNGTIVGSNYNAGGLVGYAEATDYQEVEISADFDEGDKVIDLVVENKNTKGQYEVILENIDGKTSKLIPGAVYKILDKNKNPISGYENVSLKNGSLKIATVDIETLGIDTYYIQELTPAYGYQKLDTYIKLNVRRYWDNATSSFKVSVESDNLTDDGLIQDVPDDTEDELQSQTGAIFTKVNFANVSWNSNKAEFKNCTNNGQIVAQYMNAAGIIGTSHCITELTNCDNAGMIYSQSKSGGIISELRTDTSNQFSKFIECSNSGQIVSGSTTNSYVTGSAGGIVSHIIGCIKVNNCNNIGNVIANGGQSASGIIADLDGELIADSCRNEGKIQAESLGSSPNVSSVAGGIVGKNYVNTYIFSEVTTEENIIKITNSQNYGDINASCHLGGIIGLTCASIVDIDNCEVKDSNINDTAAGDKGGIVGYSSNMRINISNCNIDNVNLERLSTIHNTYGGTAGVIGIVCKYNGSGTTTIDSVKISNCNVNNCSIKTYDKETAGIIGSEIATSGTTKNIITDCVVSNCNILNNEATSSYSSSGGIFGASYEGGTLNISNCIVDTCDIESKSQTETNGFDMNVGGVVGIAYQSNGVIVDNCDVKNSNVICNSSSTDGCANAGGIIAATGETSTLSEFKVSNCNVIETNVTTNSGNLGGVWGLAYSSNSSSTYNLLNCNVDKSHITSTSNTSSNSDTAGLMAFAYNNINIKDSSVTNSEIIGDGRNTAGVIGMGYYSLSIEDVKVLNTNITGTAVGGGTYSTSYYRTCDCVAGVAGVISMDMTFKDVIVDNCIITADNAANVSGMLGCNYNGSSKQSFKNCTVSNTDVISKLEFAETTSKSNSTTSGLIGRAGKITLDGCKVVSSNIIGKGVIVTGGVASADNITASNCYITDVDISAEPQVANTSVYDTKSIGGFVGSINGTAKLTGIHVNGLDIKSKIESIGGIFGYVSDLTKLEDCTVTGLTVKAYDPESRTNGAVAGIGAVAYSISGNIENCTVTDSEFNIGIHSAGGLFGALCNKANINNCTVDNLKINNTNEYGAYNGGIIGGLVAISENDITITNSTVKNSDFKIESGIAQPAHAGGIIGYTIGDATIKDTKVINTNIINDTVGMTGGFVGMTNFVKGTTEDVKATLNISNSSIENCKNISGKCHVGGILGFGKIVANTNTITGTIVKGLESFGDVGGIVGNNLLESVVDGVTATDINVTGVYRAGGIIGYGEGKVANANISKSTIYVTGSDAEVGGIAGNMSLEVATISGCTADQINVNSINGYNGGIVGFANTTVANCSTTNSNITSTGAEASGLGGIVGCGGINVSISDSSVTNNTLSGVNNVGEIVGNPEVTLTNCVINQIGTQSLETIEESAVVNSEVSSQVPEVQASKEVIIEKTEEDTKNIENEETIESETEEKIENDSGEETNQGTEPKETEETTSTNKIETIEKVESSTETVEAINNEAIS